MTSQTDPSENDKEMGFVAHLLELRDRLLRIVLVVGILFACLFPFAENIYNWLSEPLVSQLPNGQTLIATAVISPVFVPLKLALMVAFVIALPVIFHQLWAFIAPALYKHEKRLVIPLLVSSVSLFYLGMAFAFYVVFPLMFEILPKFVPSNVIMSPDIAQYLDFVIMIFIAFGFGFEMPIATILLVSTGMVTAQKLAEKRPYVIVGAFILGMFLTPPDVISQLLLAIPMWLLFEIGLLFSHLFKKQIKQSKKDKEAMDEERYGNSSSSTAVATAAAGTAAATSSSSNEILYENGDFVMEEIDDDDQTDDDYRPMTEEEMEAELDLLDDFDDDDKEEKESSDNDKTDSDKKN